MDNFNEYKNQRNFSSSCTPLTTEPSNTRYMSLCHSACLSNSNGNFMYLLSVVFFAFGCIFQYHELHYHALSFNKTNFPSFNIRSHRWMSNKRHFM